MNNSIIRYYRSNKIYIPRIAAIIRWLVAVLAAVISLISCITPNKTYMVPIFFIFILALSEVFCDYYAYSGINSKKNHGISFVRASKEGISFVRNALIGDNAVNFLRCLLEVGICVGLNVEGLSTGGQILFGVGTAIACYGLLGLIRFVTRFFTVSVQGYLPLAIVIMYAIFVPLLIAMVAVQNAEDAKIRLILAIVLLAVGAVLGGVMAVLNVRRGVKGYLAGFADSGTLD